MLYLYIITAAALVVSLTASRTKTIAALALAARRLLKILPRFATMMVLFSVTITLLPQEVVAGLIGRESGWLGVAFPVACSLAKKGARLGVVFAYVDFAGVCRIPMIAFEASIMGWEFTAARMAVSIPLVIVTSELLGRALEQHGYHVAE